MERKLLNLDKTLMLLKKQYTSDFVLISRCVKVGNVLKNKVFITVFKDIVAVTFEKDMKCYKVAYNFNNKFWYKYVNEEGHGVAFSPVFDEEEIIMINGEKYIDEDVIKKWGIFTFGEFGSLN